MATLGNFRTELAAVLGLDELNAAELAMMDMYVNEGVTDVLLKTHCKVVPFEMTTTAGEGDYTLPTPILVIIEMNFEDASNDWGLNRVTHAELLRMRRNSVSDAAVTVYATSGSNLLMLYPTPSSSESIVSGIYVPRPAVLSAAGSSPLEIPSEWHKAVSFYALARGADMDDDSTSEQGERYRGLYENSIQEIRRGVYRHGGARLAPARVNRRRRQLVQHDNSAD